MELHHEEAQEINLFTLSELCPSANRAAGVVFPTDIFAGISVNNGLPREVLCAVGNLHLGLVIAGKK